MKNVEVFIRPVNSNEAVDIIDDRFKFPEQFYSNYNRTVGIGKYTKFNYGPESKSFYYWYSGMEFSIQEFPSCCGVCIIRNIYKDGTVKNDVLAFEFKKLLNKIQKESKYKQFHVTLAPYEQKGIVNLFEGTMKLKPVNRFRSARTNHEIRTYIFEPKDIKYEF